MVIDIIRKLIGDVPKYYEVKGITLNNDLYYQFQHFPLIGTPEMEIDGTAVSPTYDLESGNATFSSPQTGTLSVRYKSAWFSDETIQQVMSYIVINEKLLKVGDNKWAFKIPKYPIEYELSEEDGTSLTGTFDETTMQFTITATAPVISGIAVDIYNTAGTLLLLKASNPMQIRKEFISFNNWGDYPAVAQGLREQADYWFQMSGKR